MASYLLILNLAKDELSPKLNYPLEKANASIYILPIKAEYHTDLFPDKILKNEDMHLYEENLAHRYAIEKIYLTGAFNIEAKPGDLILVYRMSDKLYKNYSSVITGLIQATCFESVDLHKKYNFLTYLVKEIEVGGGGNDFDIADKITASNFQQKRTGDKTSPVESKPDVALPKPNPVFIDEAVKKKLSEIIDEINASYNKHFDVDVATKAAFQMRDILLKNDHLKDSARSNTLKDFKFAYFDAVQEALIEGYEQNQDFFALLLDNDERKRELMQVFLEDVYNVLKEE